MSTPTTATATLPHYNSHTSHRYLYAPHSHHQPYQDPGTVAYRVNNNPALSSSRPVAYPPSGYFASSSNAASASNGVNSPAYAASHLPNDESAYPHVRTRCSAVQETTSVERA
jgi:dual-specificity kinase